MKFKYADNALEIIKSPIDRRANIDFQTENGERVYEFFVSVKLQDTVVILTKLR